MKKMFLTVALALAMFGGAQASIDTNMSNDEKNAFNLTLTEILAKNDSTPFVEKFYNIDRITIENKSNYLVRIYDLNWNLVFESTNDTIDQELQPGDYFFACEIKPRTKYVQE